MRISDGSSDVCSSDLPIGDRAGLAGVGQSINRPLDMLIFFGERSASAIGDFPYPLERQDGRIIVNAELCRRIVVARHDVRFLDARAGTEEDTSELPPLIRNSYAVFCLKKKKTQQENKHIMNTKRQTS